MARIRTPEQKAREREMRNTPQGKRARRNTLLKQRYGLTLQDFESLLTSQFQGCAICRVEKPPHLRHRYSVDHDHRTGAVRGILCQRCNVGLGLFSDSPEMLRAAAEYLEVER